MLKKAYPHTVEIQPTEAGKFRLVYPSGERVDWPELDTLAEAQADQREFDGNLRQLMRDEASERAFLPEFG